MSINIQFEQRLEETTLHWSAEAEDNARFLKDYFTQELRKVEEKTDTVEQLHRESMLRLDQLLAEERDAHVKAEKPSVASVIKRNADVELQAEYLKSCSRQEIKKVEKKTEMVEQKLNETMSQLEQQLAEEHAARLKAEDELEAALMRCTSETEEQLESLQAYSKQEIGKVEEEIMLVAQATMELEQRFKDEQMRCTTETEEQLESLEAYTKQEMGKVEKKIMMITQATLELEQRLKNEQMRCTTETEGQLESLQAYSKQEICKVEEKIMMTAQATLELEQRLEDEQTVYYKSIDSVKKDILGLDVDIGSLERRLDKNEKEKEEEVETYRSNGEKFKELIEKVEQRFRETTLRLELQLAEEKAARMRSEVLLQEAQTDSSNEIRKLKERLAKAEKETEELRKEAKSPKGVASEFPAPSSTLVRPSARRGFHEVQLKRISRNFSGSYCSYTSSDIVVPVRPHNIENHWRI